MSEATRIEALKTALSVAEKLDLREPNMIVDNAIIFDKFLTQVQDAPVTALPRKRGRPPGKG